MLYNMQACGTCKSVAKEFEEMCRQQAAQDTLQSPVVFLKHDVSAHLQIEHARGALKSNCNLFHVNNLQHCTKRATLPGLCPFVRKEAPGGVARVPTKSVI